MRHRRWRGSVCCVSIVLAVLGGLGTSLAAAPQAGATATTFYVAAISLGGNDSGGTNDCTSATTPCATVSNAVTQAQNLGNCAAALEADPTTYASCTDGDVIDVAGTIVDHVTIDSSLTVTAWPGQPPAVVDAFNNGRSFTITDDTASAPVVNLDSLTIQHGLVQTIGDAGGAIQISTSAGGPGPDVTITDSTISHNSDTSIGDGGGIALQNATLALVDSTVAYNNVTGGGSGGGIFNAGNLSIVGSTVTNNGEAQPNSKALGGGIAGGGVFTLAATIVADNTSTGVNASGPANNCAFFPGANVTSLGYNLTNDPDGTDCEMTQPTDQVNTEPGLGPLTNNGGATATELPGLGSPESGVIPNPTTVGSTQLCPRTDQRGFTVADGAPCTIGAVEAAVDCGSPVVSSTTSTVTCNPGRGGQAFEVPADVTSVAISGMGGQGGTTATRTGGLGGQSSGTLSVNPGDLLGVIVGSAGGPGSTGRSGAGGYGGGGNGGTAALSGPFSAGTGGGGGGSFVYDNGHVLVLAVGGGGGNSLANGGSGGGINGGTFPGGGGGGGPTGPGAGAQGSGSGSGPATWSNGPGAGGAGINSGNSMTPGAGGGGGFFGGGGGPEGGGGSGFLSPALTNASTTTGVNSGNGVVTFTYDNVPTVAADQPSVSAPENTAATDTGTFSSLGGSVTLTASSGTITQDNTDGTWSWAGTGDESSPSMVTITATNGSSSATTSFAVSSTDVAPSVAADQPSVSAPLNTSASNTGTFSDGDDPVTLTASAGNITQSGSQNGTWAWSGTVAATSFTVTVTATNGDGATDSTSFTVNPAAIAPAITSGSTAAFTVGTPASFDVTTTGTPMPGLSEAGSLPPGVTFSDKGDGTATVAYDGTAATARRVSVTVTASNGVAPDGTQKLTVKLLPSVASVTPDSGPLSGGTPITITGTGFGHGASVVIGQGHGARTGGIAATNVTVVSPTEITAVTGGSAKLGHFDVFVTSGQVTSAGNSAARFTYLAPTVTSVSPASGPIGGGTPVTITGTGFVPGATVVIGQGHGAGTGAIAATNVTVVSPTEITAVTGGPATGGTWNVFVTSGGLTTAPNGGDQFTYH